MRVRSYQQYRFFTVFIAACLFSVLLSGVVNAATEDALWNKANTFYTQKQYDSAAVYYDLLLKKYPDHAVLQYNMGNTCYRLNKVGEAILHYEKAAFLDPGNKMVEDNLQLAKARVQNPLPEVPPIFFVKWWNGLLHIFSSNTWAVLTLLVFLGVLALIYYSRVKKEQFAHSGRWLSLGIAGLLIFACMTYFSYDAASNSRKAVVLQGAATLVDAPRPSGKVLNNLPEGTVIEVFGEDGSYFNVKLPNGREGWVAAQVVEKV